MNTHPLGRVVSLGRGTLYPGEIRGSGSIIDAVLVGHGCDNPWVGNPRLLILFYLHVFTLSV